MSYARRSVDSSNASESEARGMSSLQETAAEFATVLRLRPASLSAFFLKLFGPEERRRIVRTDDGIRVFADPFSNLGQSILHDNVYEPETGAIIRGILRPGDTFLDIGANEGYFSALAASIVGERGTVIAVEPQERLCDLIRLNMELNGRGSLHVFNNAIGGDDGEIGTINLWPLLNSGASGMAVRYRFSRKVQQVRFIRPETLLRSADSQQVTLAKIDVEGFEPEVVAHLIPLLRMRRIDQILLDYHESQLRERNIDPRSVHEDLAAAGYGPAGPTPPSLSSYVLYTSSESPSRADCELSGPDMPP